MEEEKIHRVPVVHSIRADIADAFRIVCTINKVTYSSLVEAYMSKYIDENSK